MILSNYAIKFRTAVFVFIAVLVLAGAVSYVSLPREGACFVRSGFLPEAQLHQRGDRVPIQ